MSEYTQVSLFDNPDSNKPLPEIIADGGDNWAAFPLAFHDIEDTRYYAVQDWIRGISQSQKASSFWREMNKRVFKMHSVQLSTSCLQLPYVAKNGKTYQMDFAAAHTLYSIVQYMDSSSSIRKSVLDYLAKAGVKLDEYRLNPDQAIIDGIDGLPKHQLRGPHKDDPAWVEARLMGIVSRKEFTDALRDFVKDPDYPRATNEVYMGVFGLLASEIRKALDVSPKVELRNYMSRPALMALGYAEAWVSATIVDYGEELSMDTVTEQITYIANEVGRTQRTLAENAGVDLLTGKKLITAGKR